VDAIAENVEKTLDTYPEGRRKDAVLLFSAHSLPMSVVNRGESLLTFLRYSEGEPLLMEY
jgi:ferrochelatase